MGLIPDALRTSRTRSTATANSPSPVRNRTRLLTPSPVRDGRQLGVEQTDQLVHVVALERRLDDCGTGALQPGARRRVRTPGRDRVAIGLQRQAQVQVGSHVIRIKE